MGNSRRSKFKVVVAFVLGVIVTLCGVLAALNFGGLVIVHGDDKGILKNVVKDYGNLPEILKLIKTKSIFNFDDVKARDGAYRAIVDSLGDEYSQYMNAEETKEWESLLNGEFSGIGISFSKNGEGKYQVSEVFPKGPAEKAGMKPGDLILSVDGKTYDSIEEMSSHIKGESGTKVKIVLLRDGKEIPVEMVRETVKEKTVSGEVLEGNIGYIRISSFEERTSNEFEAQLNSFENQGIKKMILDLRNNGGGYTDEGIRIADLILKEGTITYMEDVKGKRQYFNSDEKATKIKYVVLVNENTASTSEILTAAIKDNKGGKIVGTTTFGKGIVQENIKFRDGSSLKLTVMRYYSPKGHAIHKKGIKPDVEVSLDTEGNVDNQLEKAKEVLAQ